MCPFHKPCAMYTWCYFYMGGKLHLPIPAMILSGPLYRAELSFMNILFISTIVLSGPAWCSYLCYFGASDNYSVAAKSRAIKTLKTKSQVYHVHYVVIELHSAM